MKILSHSAASLPGAVLSYLQDRALTPEQITAIRGNCVPKVERAPLYRTLRLSKKPRGGRSTPLRFHTAFGSVSATREASLGTVLAQCHAQKQTFNWLATYEIHNVALVLSTTDLLRIVREYDDKQLVKQLERRINLRQESMVVGTRSYTGVLLKLVSGRYIAKQDEWPALLEEWEAQL